MPPPSAGSRTAPPSGRTHRAPCSMVMAPLSFSACQESRRWNNRVDHGAHSAHVADAPLRVRVLGPTGDGIRRRGLVGLHHVHLHGGGAERHDIADVLRGASFSVSKRESSSAESASVSSWVSRTSAHSGPAAAPVGPVIRHAYRVDLAFRLGFFNDGGPAALPAGQRFCRAFARRSGDRRYIIVPYRTATAFCGCFSWCSP